MKRQVEEIVCHDYKRLVSKVISPIILCSTATSDADVGYLAQEVQFPGDVLTYFFRLIQIAAKHEC